MQDINDAAQNNVQSHQPQQPSKGNKPVETLWDGSVKMAIFANQREKRVFHTLQKPDVSTPISMAT